MGGAEMGPLPCRWRALALQGLEDSSGALGGWNYGCLLVLAYVYSLQSVSYFCENTFYCLKGRLFSLAL